MSTKGPKSRVLELLQSRYPGYHPILALADMVNSDRTDIEPELEFRVHAKLASYVEPELKSVEVKGVLEEQRRVTITLFDQDVTVKDVIDDADYAAIDVVKND